MNKRGFVSESILLFAMFVFCLGMGIYAKTLFRTWDTGLLELIQYFFIFISLYFLAKTFSSVGG
jgi:hypothetical protein